MSTAELVIYHHRRGEPFTIGFKAFFKTFYLIFLGSLLMVLPLLYVWPHLQMTELEYQIAEQMSIREKLLEGRERLKLEYATLKAPQRIETIAKDNLMMIYPERFQVVYLKR